MCCLPYCLSSPAAFPTLIHYKIPSENSLTVQKLQMKNKNSNYFLRIQEKETKDYISVGKSLFHKLCSVHSCIFMSELYFCLFLLYSAESSVTWALILADTREFCKCSLCVINCSQTCAAQAAFWQQANMFSASCRPWVGLWTSSACDRCVTPQSTTSSQGEHKKPLRKGGSKDKFSGRLSKRACWLKRTT